MPHGTGSTLVIKPNAAHLADVTIGLSGGEPYEGTSDYICPLQTLDFNEEQRRAVVYAQAPPGEGGRAVLDYAPLVPIPMTLVIKTETVAERIAAYNAIQDVLLDPEGGTIKYKPEGIGAGVLDTYYHYLQSPPPRLLDEPGNRWDAAVKSDKYFTLQIQVQFMTQPIATSDPESPVTLTELSTTIDNWVDDSPSQNNGVSLTAANLKGTLPALLRIMVRPGAGRRLGRLLIFDRAGSNFATNFDCLLEAEDASIIYPSSAWSQVSDSSRGDGAYMACYPAIEANGVAQGLQFTMPTPAYYKGRFAVLGIGKDDTEIAQAWTHQVKVRIGNVVQTGPAHYYAEHRNTWSVIFAGEFDFPPTPESDVETGYDTGPFLEWYSTRVSGNSQFSLDAIFLFFVADKNSQPSAIDFICDDEGGVTNSEKLLVENFTQSQGVITEIAHVIAQSDSDFKRVLTTAARGDYLTLDPARDHYLMFLQERFTGVILEDDFSTYEASRWLGIDDFNDLAGWSKLTADTTNYLEGTQSGRHAEPPALDALKTVSLDLSNEGRFTDDDYVLLCVYGEDVAGLIWFYFRFLTSPGNYYFSIYETLDASTWNFLKIKKSNFGAQGSPDWANITELQFIRSYSGSLILSYDHWRIEKADPDDATSPNPTGSVWDFQPTGGEWAITEDISGAGTTLACLEAESGVEKCAEIAATMSADIQYRAQCRVKGTTGYAGIIWRSSDITSGSEDFYSALLDLDHNWLITEEYNAGTPTGKGQADFTCVGNTWYTVGVFAKGSTHKVYATASSNLTNQDDIFNSIYLLVEFTDATHASGQAGLMAVSAQARFGDVKLYDITDRVMPADTITLEGKAIFRTIAPFSE